jgi:glycine reductase
MSFALRTWDVHTVRPAGATRLRDGVLEVDIGELEALAVAPVSAIEIQLVSPGQGIRITHVLDAAIPAVKADQPEATFPGILGPAARAGDGVTHRLAGINVISVADFGALTPAAEVPIEGDSLIDMSGPGAVACPFSATHNVVLFFRLEPDSDPVEADRAIRKVTLTVARRLAESTLAAANPDHVLELPLPESAELPAIAVVLQVASEGPVNDTFLYGRPMVGARACTIDAAEVLDGALVSGAYDYAGLRNVTAFYQDNALIRTLLREHGSTLLFSGVVLTLAFLNDPDDKRAWAEDAATQAAELGVDGVVITAFQSGNSQTDVMLTIRACEARGIRTVAIVAETDAGLVDRVPEADALVSSGNEDELVAAWAPDTMVGPGVFEDGTPASRPRPLPILVYLGAIEQTGGSRLRAETS